MWLFRAARAGITLARVNTATSKDGTVLAYDVYGSGPALIYITGASCFRRFAPVLQDARVFAKEFTVYHYDRRGRGDSGDVQPWSVDREVEDIEALIDAAGGRAFLYGHSSGAVLALEAGLRLAGKVQKAVLFDPAYVHDASEKAEYALLREKTARLLKAGNNASAMKGFLRGIGMPGVFVTLLPLFPGWRTMKALAPTLAYDMALTSDPPPVERAATLSAPLHIIVGQKSPAPLHKVADQLARAVPNSRLTTLAGQDHMPSAKVVLPVLVAFLK